MRLRWWKKSDDAGGRLPEPLKLRYYAFRNILITNNRAMEVLARLEKASDKGGATLPQVKSMVRSLVKMTGEMTQGLSVMTGEPMKKLDEARERIARPIREALAEPSMLPDAPLVMELSGLEVKDLMLAGGKAVALAEAGRALGDSALVPPGFVVSTRAEKLFMERNNLEKYIDEVLADLSGLEDKRLADRSGKIREIIRQAIVPDELRTALSREAEALAGKCRAPLMLAVRSNAVGEDSSMSFAGQFDSILNVEPKRLADAYKSVLAGKYSERSLAYMMNHGLAREDVPMAVLCMPMFEPRAAGVLYTADPNGIDPETMIISSNFGLGGIVASGAANADLFRAPWRGDIMAAKKEIAQKTVMLMPGPPGEIEEKPVPPETAGAPSLDDRDLERLRDAGVKLMNHFRAPQDVEWAVLEDGEVIILQTRPLVMSDASGAPTQILPDGYPKPMIADALPASGGIASGPAFHAAGNPRKDRPPRGAVLVAAKADLDYSIHLSRITAMIVEQASPAAHLSTLLREKKIPAVMGAKRAMSLIEQGSTVTVDGCRGAVIEGDKATELGPAPSSEPTPMMDSARIWMEPIRKWIVPLNLTSLLSMTFNPSAIKTIHDLIRYVHEMSVRAMFETGDSVTHSRSNRALRLESPLPVRILVIDLTDGTATGGADGSIQPARLRSRPFQALYRGMTRPGIKWAGAPRLSARGFASVLVTAAADPGLASRTLGGDSYLLLSEDYMNLNARLAYHFVMVDANLSDQDKDNYINFRFKGGGAGLDRRMRRARFLEGVLSSYGFTVTIEQDLLNAWIKAAGRAEMEDCLAMIGSLMGCARQLDMAMDSDSSMEWFKKAFLEGNYGFSTEN